MIIFVPIFCKFGPSNSEQLLVCPAVEVLASNVISFRPKVPPDDKSARGALSRNGVVGGVACYLDPRGHGQRRSPTLPTRISFRTAGLIRSYQTLSPLCHLRKTAQQQ